MKKRWMQKYKENYKLRRAIKESFDYLPSGICFFDKRGLQILCNLKMQQLIFEMTGQNLQSFYDIENLRTSLEGLDKSQEDTFLLKSGKVWRFQKRIIKNEVGGDYIQVVASDMTELYQKREELAKKNEKLAEEKERIEILTQNIQEITKQEELLNAKRKVHEQMSENLEKVRMILQGEEK